MILCREKSQGTQQKVPQARRLTDRLFSGAVNIHAHEHAVTCACVFLNHML